MKSERITVALIEDDRQVREDIEEFLHSHDRFECLLGAESVEEFQTVLPKGSYPDVLLMDIGLPGMSGIDGVKLVKSRSPKTEILMLTIYLDPRRVFDALCFGASGYLLKGAPFRELATAIETLHRGGSAMSPEIARMVIDHFHPKKTRNRESTLSPKEREVVVGLVDGLSYKQIADRMSISIQTVRVHIRNIYSKLHVHSKADVIRKSLRDEI